MFQPKNWIDDDTEMRRLLKAPEAPGITVQRSRYALTGPRSWTLVPNTDSCVADVLFLPRRRPDNPNRFLHRRTRKWYTFLTSPGSNVWIVINDYRPDSPTFGAEESFCITADPRVSIAVDPGIAYALACETDLLVRCEHEVFVADDEPRPDLPDFGRDLIVLRGAERPAGNPRLPSLRCPGEVVRQMARTEQQVLVEGE